MSWVTFPAYRIGRGNGAAKRGELAMANGKAKPKGNTAMATAMAAAKSGPTKPDYVPDTAWAEMTDDEKSFAADPANAAVVKAAYAEGEGEGNKAPEDTGERVASVVAAGDIPVTFRNQTDTLAGKITDADRELFVEAWQKEMEAKQRTVALYAIIVRAYGEGATGLPRYGTTAKDSNLPDLFEYRKKTSQGKWAKKPVEGSVLEIAAYKALISAADHNRIAELEKQIRGLAEGVQVPFEWQNELDVLRSKRNKMISKFVSAVRLVHALYDIAQCLRIGWAWIADNGTTDVTDDLSNLTFANTCILLFAKNKDGSRGMSVAHTPSSIVDYSVLRAGGEAEATLDTLMKSAEPEAPTTPEGEADIEVNDYETCTRVLTGAYTFLHKFIGANANKAEANRFANHMVTDAAANLRAAIFRLVEDLQEGVTTRPDIRNKWLADNNRINQAMGGDASRQVKDQPDGLQPKTAAVA